MMMKKSNSLDKRALMDPAILEESSFEDIDEVQSISDSPKYRDFVQLIDFDYDPLEHIEVRTPRAASNQRRNIRVSSLMERIRNID